VEIKASAKTGDRARVASDPDELGPRQDWELRLVRRLQARDPLALGELYDQFGALVYRVALRVTGDATAAEDLTQETFISIWNRIDTFDAARGSLGCWVGMLARCRSIDYLRSLDYRVSRNSAPLEGAEPKVSAAELPAGLLRSERIRLLRGPWMRLKSHERHTLHLAYYGGLTQPEIAEKLNRPLGTVKSWMRKGLRTLQIELEGVNVP
jgi:RNA polymerase sigma-70 factor (ECF subfamily)